MESSPSYKPSRVYRAYSHGELIADGVVHAAALVAGLIGFSLLFQRIALYGGPADGAAIGVYAATFFLVFGFSCAYNMTPPSRAKWLLRRFDHASIFLMIGGTYTALLSQAYFAIWTVALAATVWTSALAGALVKLFLPARFDRASIAVYLALGWLSLVAIKPLMGALPAGTLALVAAGGALYSMGVAFHLWESLKYQNVLWHLCVAVAAVCQLAGVFWAVGR